jgi:hypothetical protein
VNDNIELVFFFDGTQPQLKCTTDGGPWYEKQLDDRRRANRIFHAQSARDHLRWGDGAGRNAASADEMPHRSIDNWIQPACLKDMILHEVNNDVAMTECKRSLYSRNQPIRVYYTLDDHRMEMMKYCATNKCHFMFTNDLELISLFLRNKDYQAGQANLRGVEFFMGKTFKLERASRDTPAAIHAKRFNMGKILRYFQMDEDQFAWFTILLGTRWFPAEWLSAFYKNISEEKLDTPVSYF